MKRGKSRKKKKDKSVPILIATIIVLIIGLGIEAYMLRLTVLELRQEKDINNQLNIEKQALTSDLKSIEDNYSLLYQDVQEIYKSCMNEGPCRGHFPGISWYCNNVGDEAIDSPSHICSCDPSCNLKAVEIIL